MFFIVLLLLRMFSGKVICPHAAVRILSCGKNFKSTPFLVKTSIHSTTEKLTKYIPSELRNL